MSNTPQIVKLVNSQQQCLSSFPLFFTKQAQHFRNSHYVFDTRYYHFCTVRFTIQQQRFQ